MLSQSIEGLGSELTVLDARMTTEAAAPAQVCLTSRVSIYRTCLALLLALSPSNQGEEACR